MIDYWLPQQSAGRRFWPVESATGRVINGDVDIRDLLRHISPDAQQARHCATINPSMRAFRRALHDACRARLCRRQAKRATSPWHRARLIQIAEQCEARVCYAADMAMRGSR